jgi:threonine dehydratase
MPVTLSDIRAARDRIAGAVYRSPCPYSLLLSRLLNCRVYCKLDHLQVTGSFKERGARNRLSKLNDDQKRRGVIAASAGNHALALACHGKALGIPVTVVMPIWAPLTKVTNCRSFGATIIQHGESFDDAKARAMQICEEQKMTYVHGFDDDDIIAGAGTIGLEILDDVPDVDAVIIPVGGGGLIAGAGVAIKSLKPSVRVIGVETANAPTLRASLDAGKIVKIPSKPTLADGLAIAEVGVRCFELAKKYVDEVVLVDEAHIARAVLRLLELEKTVLEGAGAASLAAMLQHDLHLQDKTVVLVLCGGNIDLTMISRVIDRGLAADGRLCRFVCSISDRPGGLAFLTTLLAKAGASVKEIDHDRNFAGADIATVYVNCVLETRDHVHIVEIEKALREAGVSVISRTP